MHPVRNTTGIYVQGVLVTDAGVADEMLDVDEEVTKTQIEMGIVNDMRIRAPEK